MHKIILKCKTITPLFMSGSDSKTPELRPASFKGMMRFWWRAVQSESNVQELKQREAEIFGGSGDKEGKSKILIKVYPQPREFGSNLQQENQLRWNFNRQTRRLEGLHQGIGYLFYSLIQRNRERQYIKPDFEFHLEISSNNLESFKHAVNALWAAIYLGGFGSRSRRGAGSIEVISLESNNSIDVDFRISQGNTNNAIKQYLEKNINKILKKNNNPINYPSLQRSKILILEPSENWKDALNKIGEIYANFRYRNKNRIFEMGIFGMPIIHSNSNIKIVPYKLVENRPKKISERMASPLIIKLIRFQNKIYPIIIKLSIPKILVGKEQNNRFQERQEVNDSVINDFLNSINNKQEIQL